MMSKKSHWDRCCNPYKLEYHRVSKELRTPSVHLRAKSNLTTNDLICLKCRLRLSKELAPIMQPETVTRDSEATDSENIGVQSINPDLPLDSHDCQPPFYDNIVHQPSYLNTPDNDGATIDTSTASNSDLKTAENDDGENYSPYNNN